MKEAIELIHNKMMQMQSDANFARSNSIAFAEAAYRDAEHEIKSLRKALQLICPHDKTTDNIFEDYHKNETNTKTVCDICEKLVKRNGHAV